MTPGVIANITLTSMIRGSGVQHRVERRKQSLSTVRIVSDIKEHRVKVVVTCRHGNLSGEIQKHIEGKAAKLANYLTQITSVNVTVDMESGEHVKVEMLVDAEHKHNFVSRAEGGPDDNVFVVFDNTFQKMEQQIKKHKEKRHDHRRDKPLNEVANIPEDEDRDQ